MQLKPSNKSSQFNPRPKENDMMCAMLHVYPACPVEFTGGDSAAYSTGAPCSLHAYHLYVIRLKGVDREKVFKSLRERDIGVNVHYIPVHLHPFYRNRFGTDSGHCPIAESAYESIISLPIFPGMTDDNVEKVIEAVNEAVKQ